MTHLSLNNSSATNRAAPHAETTDTRRLLTLNDFCRDYRLSRASAYRLIRDGKLRSVRILGRRLIPVEAAEALLEGGA